MADELLIVLLKKSSVIKEIQETHELFHVFNLSSKTKYFMFWCLK